MEWFREKKAEEYGIKREQVVVLEGANGSIWVRWTSVCPEDTQKVVDLSHKKRLQLHSYFRKFKLSPDDFDPAFNYHYRDKHWREWRGDWFYYLPVFCKKYALKVKDLYASNDWVEEGNQGWAVGFHGVASPLAEVEGTGLNVFESIMGGLYEGEMLKPGKTQLYELERAVNKEEELMETGVYFSPHVYVCQNYAKAMRVNGTYYRLVLQCRLAPEAIKVCRKDERKWVVKDPTNIRPYGAILIKEEDYERVFNSRFRFGKFRWQEQVQARGEGRATLKY